MPDDYSFGGLRPHMDLPRGITGFRHVDDAPLPVCDVADFRRHCHAVARTLHGRVKSVDAPLQGVAANFVCAVLEVPGGIATVLLNAHFPVIAFAEPLGESAKQIRFIDVPELERLFKGFTYRVLTTSELGQPIRADICEQLAPEEQKQVKYWRPSRIGDLVFNTWD